MWPSLAPTGTGAQAENKEAFVRPPAHGRRPLSPSCCVTMTSSFPCQVIKSILEFIKALERGAERRKHRSSLPFFCTAELIQISKATCASHFHKLHSTRIPLTRQNSQFSLAMTTWTFISKSASILSHGEYASAAFVCFCGIH